MHEASLTVVALPAMVIALCFALGLNTYGCLFALGAMARLDWVALPVGLDGLEHGWALGVLGALFVGEFVADKMPGLDVVWHLLQTLVRVPAAGVVAFAATSSLPLTGRILIALAGMGIASVAHGAKVALRVAAVAKPELGSNVALSLVEDGIAFGLGWLALRSPMDAGIVAACMGIAALGFGCCGLRSIRRGFARRFEDRRVRIVGSVADRRLRISAEDLGGEKFGWARQAEAGAGVLCGGFARENGVEETSAF